MSGMTRQQARAHWERYLSSEEERVRKRFAAMDDRLDEVERNIRIAQRSVTHISPDALRAQLVRMQDAIEEMRKERSRTHNQLRDEAVMELREIMHRMIEVAVRNNLRVLLAAQPDELVARALMRASLAEVDPLP
jgi:hypothetical protein